MQQVKRAPAEAKLRLERARARYGFVDVAMRTFRRFSEDDGGSYAAALTYFTFFSIFPLLLLGVAILGYLTFLNPQLKARIIEASVEAVPLMRDVLKPEGLERIMNQRQELAVTGALLALYSGTGAIAALEHALNKIFRVEQEPNFVTKRLRALRWLGVLGGLVVLSVTITGVTGLDVSGSSAETDDLWKEALGHVVGGLIGIAIFATAFRFLPGRRLSWGGVLPGAVVAGVAFELLKLFGTLVFESGPGSREATFGVFALAAGLLVASYLIAQLTLLAAELNAVLIERKEVRTSLRESQET
jgi:YihY family inner membrane protein